MCGGLSNQGGQIRQYKGVRNTASHGDTAMKAVPINCLEYRRTLQKNEWVFLIGWWTLRLSMMTPSFMAALKSTRSQLVFAGYAHWFTHIWEYCQHGVMENSRFFTNYYILILRMGWTSSDAFAKKVDYIEPPTSSFQTRSLCTLTLKRVRQYIVFQNGQNKWKKELPEDFPPHNFLIRVLWIVLTKNIFTY